MSATFKIVLMAMVSVLVLTAWIAPRTYPTIVLAEKYGRTGEHADKAKVYYIKPTAALNVDPTRMNFREVKWMNHPKLPTKIFVMADGMMYTMPFTPDKIMLLDASHLANAQGIIPFDGFKANTSFFIGVGEVEMVDDKAVVKTCWTTLVKVRG